MSTSETDPQLPSEQSTGMEPLLGGTMKASDWLAKLKTIRFKDPLAVPLASALLKHKYVTVRRAAIRKLGDYLWGPGRFDAGVWDVVDVCATAMEDADQCVRNWACSSMSRVEACGPYLLRMARNPYPDVRTWAVWEACWMCGPDGPAAAALLLDDTDPDVRRLAAHALLRLPRAEVFSSDPTIADAFRRLLQHSEGLVVVAAAVASTGDGQAEASGFLVCLRFAATDAVEPNRTAAADVLRLLGETVPPEPT